MAFRSGELRNIGRPRSASKTSYQDDGQALYICGTWPSLPSNLWPNLSDRSRRIWSRSARIRPSAPYRTTSRSSRVRPQDQTFRLDEGLAFICLPLLDGDARHRSRSPRARQACGFRGRRDATRQRGVRRVHRAALGAADRAGRGKRLAGRKWLALWCGRLSLICAVSRLRLYPQAGATSF